MAGNHAVLFFGRGCCKPPFVSLSTMIIRIVLCVFFVFDKKNGCGRARWSGVDELQRGLESSPLSCSVWVVCGSDSSLACFQKRQGKTEKLTSHRPFPSQKKPSLNKQTEQEKEHNSWLLEGNMSKCGGLKRRVCVLSVIRRRRVWREAHILLVCDLLSPHVFVFGGPFHERRCQSIWCNSEYQNARVP